MQRERRALLRLRGVDGVPRLLANGCDHLDRSLLEGATLAERPPELEWFRSARRILRQLRHRGVAHNDLAKEQNWLVLDDGGAGVVDFQLAVIARPRRPLLRLMAREDLRHLLKHKRAFHRAALRPVDRRLLARRSWFARAWRQTWKRAYNVMTRRVLGVRDGEGTRTSRRS